MTIADINTLTRYLSNTDTTSLTAANLLILVNASYERIIGKILAETGGGKWPAGDINYTAFPTYTLDMTNSTAEYQIDSFGADADTRPLIILGAEVLDNSSNWHKLYPISLQDIRSTETAQSEFYETDGIPQYYEKREHMIVLYPAPDNGVSVTLTAGLRLFFLRRADIFTSAEVTTGTKEPGFPSPYHDILAYEAAMAYCALYKPERVEYLRAELFRKEKELMDFIAFRNPDDDFVITQRSISYR